MGETVGGILGTVACLLSPALVENSLSFAKRGGHYAVLAGGVLSRAYSIYAAIRQNSFAVFALGLGLVVALAIAQFVAMRFLDAADTLIDATPSHVSSPAFLECARLMVLLFAAGTLLSGVAGAIAARSFMVLLPAVLLGFAQGIVGSLPIPVPVSSGQIGSALLVVACLVPIVAYFGFLLQCLMVDLARAVLSVPGKLDALKK